MHRRDFFKSGIQATVVGASVSLPTYSSIAADSATIAACRHGLLEDYSGEDHRRRLQNIGIGNMRLDDAVVLRLVTMF